MGAVHKETVTYGEKNDGKLIMTFQRLNERERRNYKRSVEELLEMPEIQKLSRAPGTRIDQIILSKLNTN